MQTATHASLRSFAAVLAALSMAVVGSTLTTTPAEAQDQAEPFFAVSPVEPADHMWGQEWLPGSTVRVDIDDPAVAGGVDFTTTLPTDDNGRFEVFDLPFDIQPGQLVTVVQNQEYVKTHEVIDVTIDEVDVVADTVSGTAAADTVTVVVVFPEFSVQVTSDGAGAWAADLGAEGFDLRPGQTVYVYQADEDGDQSQIDRYLPEGERLVFRGFADPVDNDVTNLATAGRAVPLKFRVTRGDDVPVTDISNVSVTVTDLQCELGMTADLVEEYAAGKSGLQNLGDGHYQYNWKTSKSYKNSCKLLTLDIGDGVAHTAEFDFVR